MGPWQAQSCGPLGGLRSGVLGLGAGEVPRWAGAWLLQNSLVVGRRSCSCLALKRMNHGRNSAAAHGQPKVVTLLLVPCHLDLPRLAAAVAATLREAE